MNADAHSSQRPGRLLGAVFNYGVGSYVPQIVNFLLVPVYTYVLTPNEMGVAEVFLSAGLVLTILMRLGLPGAVTRLYFECSNEGDVRALFSTVAKAVALSSLLIGGASLLVAPWFRDRFAPGLPVSPHVLLVVGASVLQSLVDVHRRFQQARERSREAVWFSFIGGIAATGFNVLFVIALRQGVLGILWGNLLGIATVFLVAAYRSRHELRGKFTRAVFSSAARYGLPHVPHHAAAWVQQFGNRYVLAAVTSLAAVGHFGMATRLASPLAVAVAAFATAYPPIYFSWRSHLEARDALVHARRVGRWAVVLGGVACVGAAALGRPVVWHLFEAEFTASAPAIGPVAAAMFAHLLYTLVVAEIFFAKRTQWISIIFIVSAAANLVTLTVLPTEWGALAAGVAQAVGAVVSVLMVCMLSRRSFALPLDSRSTFGALALGGISLAVPLLPSMGSTAGDLAVGTSIVAVAAAFGLWTTGTIRELPQQLARFQRTPREPGIRSAGGSAE